MPRKPDNGYSAMTPAQRQAKKRMKHMLHVEAAKGYVADAIKANAQGDQRTVAHFLALLEGHIREM